MRRLTLAIAALCAPLAAQAAGSYNLTATVSTPTQLTLTGEGPMYGSSQILISSLDSYTSGDWSVTGLSLIYQCDSSSCTVSFAGLAQHLKEPPGHSPGAGSAIDFAVSATFASDYIGPWKQTDSGFAGHEEHSDKLTALLSGNTATGGNGTLSYSVTILHTPLPGALAAMLGGLGALGAAAMRAPRPVARPVAA